MSFLKKINTTVARAKQSVRTPSPFLLLSLSVVGVLLCNKNEQDKDKEVGKVESETRC